MIPFLQVEIDKLSDKAITHGPVQQALEYALSNCELVLL